MNISVVESIQFTPAQRERLNSLGEVTWFEGVPDVNTLVKRSEGAEILAIDWAPIDAAVDLFPSSVKFISLPFTGVGFLPLKNSQKKEYNLQMFQVTPLKALENLASDF